MTAPPAAPEGVASTRATLVVGAILLCLTALTVGLAQVDLRGWNTLVGLAIAALKAILIALFFMHVRASSGMTRLVAVAALVWLSILLLGTLDDVLTRAWLPTPGR